MFSGALAGLAGISEVAGAIQQLRPVISPGYGFTAIIVAFLGRLNPFGISGSGLVLALTYLGSEAAQITLGISDKIGRVFQGLVLFFVLSCDTLIYYRIKFSMTRQAGGFGMMTEAILLTIFTAATPLLLAAMGELVTERSGVLNLGVEGMMIMGAVAGFSFAQMTGNPYIGRLAGLWSVHCFPCCLAFWCLPLWQIRWQPVWH